MLLQVRSKILLFFSLLSCCCGFCFCNSLFGKVECWGRRKENGGKDGLEGSGRRRMKNGGG